MQRPLFLRPSFIPAYAILLGVILALLSAPAQVHTLCKTASPEIFANACHTFIDILAFADGAITYAITTISNILTDASSLAVPFVDLSKGRIDEGFATAIGGVSVLLGAVFGFAVPAARERKAALKEALAIAETLAAEVSVIADHIDGQLSELLKQSSRPNDIKNFARKVSNRVLPQAIALQAFVGNIHLLARLTGGRKLVQDIFVWHSYAEQIRSRQTKLGSMVDDGRPDDNNLDDELRSVCQSVKDRTENLLEKRQWADLVESFRSFEIDLTAMRESRKK